MAGEQRTLILLRHAKSDWPVGVADVHRPLADRGRRDAPAAGAWLRTHVGVPDTVRVSPAQRTRETWMAVAGEWAEHGIVPPEPLWDERIYEAEVDDLIDVVRGIDDHSHTALLIGHNYGLEDLAGVPLADPVAAQRLATKFPTSAIAVIAVAGRWSEFPVGAYLQRIEIPRG